MQGEYKLGQAEHLKIFKNRILPEFLGPTTAQDEPVAIITGGQPGAGKARLVALAYRELEARGGAVVVDADMLRAHHPEYARLVHSGNLNAANLTHADAGEWAVRLRASAIEGRRNIIIDQTSRDPAAFEAICQELRKGGVTRIELRAMAVPPAVSRLRIFARYESQLEHGGGRFSTRGNHDAAYEGLAKTIGLVAAKGLVDGIKLYNADHVEIHSNERLEGKWASPASPAAALQLERTRPITSSERTGYIASLFDVLDRAMQRRAGARYMDDVRGLAKELGEDLPLGQPGEIYRGRIVHVGEMEIIQRTEQGLVEHKKLLVRDAEKVQVGLDASIEYDGAGRGVAKLQERGHEAGRRR